MESTTIRIQAEVLQHDRTSCRFTADRAVYNGFIRFITRERARSSGFDLEADRVDGNLDGKLRTVRPHGHHLDAFAEHRPFAGCVIMGNPAPVPVASAGRDDHFGKLLSDDLGLRRIHPRLQ